MSDYMKWLTGNTKTKWWYDSSIACEAKLAIADGACGLASNPPICYSAIKADYDGWRKKLAFCKDLSGTEKVEAIYRTVMEPVFETFMPMFISSNGEKGTCCVQVDPTSCGDYEAMRTQAYRMAKWSPNVSIKVPGTSAGIRLMSELVEKGINVTVTLGFFVAEMVEVAIQYEEAFERAQQAGRVPGHCNAVLMIGRTEGNVREVVDDNVITCVMKDDLNWVGIALAKKTEEIYRDYSHSPQITIAAFRSSLHITALAGGPFTLVLPYSTIKNLKLEDEPHIEHFNEPIPEGVLDRLHEIELFRKYYYEDGIAPKDFVLDGSLQRTAGQFVGSGWAPMANLSL